jgi:hypothetical protein
MKLNKRDLNNCFALIEISKHKSVVVFLALAFVACSKKEPNKDYSYSFPYTYSYPYNYYNGSNYSNAGGGTGSSQSRPQYSYSNSGGGTGSSQSRPQYSYSNSGGGTGSSQSRPQYSYSNSGSAPHARPAAPANAKVLTPIEQARQSEQIVDGDSTKEAGQKFAKKCERLAGLSQLAIDQRALQHASDESNFNYFKLLYRSLAKKFHSDKDKGYVDANEEMKLLNAAWGAFQNARDNGIYVEAINTAG